MLRSFALLILGLVLVISALGLGVKARQRLTTFESAPGTVVRLLAGGSHPEIRFTSREGQVVTFPQGGLIAGYAVGRPVRVLYDPKEPTGAATLDVPGAVLAGPLLTGGLGLILILVGAIPLVFRAWTRSRPLPLSASPGLGPGGHPIRSQRAEPL